MLRNSQQTYGLIAQLFHWATAVLVLILIPLGIYMHDLPADTAAEAADKSWFYSLHKTLGVAVFFLAILRVAWTLIQPHPKPLHADRRLETLAAQTVHWTLYGAIIVMPLSGWIHHSALDGFAPIWWPLPQDLPLVPKSPPVAMVFGTLHFFTSILLGVCLFLHVGGALKHQFVDRDQTLLRMTPFKRIVVSESLAKARERALPPVLALLAFVVVGIVTFSWFVLDAGDTVSETAASNVENTGEAAWIVDAQNSRLGIQIIQSGSPVEGEFTDWNATINFDPDNLQTAGVLVVINTASLAIGVVTDQALTAQFLNVEQYPSARFQSDEFVETGAGRYEARGLLELVGKSNPVTLPFTLKIEDGRAFMEGTARLERLEFGIGGEGFSDDKMLGFGVEVIVSIEADKAPAE